MFYQKTPQCGNSGCNLLGGLFLSTNTRICSRHFVGGVKSEAHPIPTVFSWSKKKRAPPRERPLPSLPPPKQPKLEVQLYEALDDAQKEIDARDARIEELEAEVVGLRVEVFRIQRFSSSDLDISFYTGLPSYATIFRFIEPLLGQLNYRCPFKPPSIPTISTIIH